MDSAFPIASLSNEEINKLIVELSAKQGLQVNRQQLEQYRDLHQQQHQSNSQTTVINSSSNEISLERSSSLSSSGANNTATEEDTRHYQLDSIDQEEDAPIVINHLHSVKSLKKFFEIKANSKCFNQGLNPNASNLKPCNSMNEKSRKPVETVLDDSMSAFASNILAKSSQDCELIPVEVFTNKKGNDLNEEPKNLTGIPCAPPLPDFFGSKSTHSSFISTTRASREEIVTETSLPPAGLGGFNQNIVSQCKQFKLHERLIREIHHKTLERAKKDVNLCLDKHGNLINRNHVYKAEVNMRRFSRHLKKNNAESFIQAMIKNEDNDAAAFENQSNENKLKAASFRSDMSVRSTGSAYSSRSMLSEARAKLEAYSGGKTTKP